MPDRSASLRNARQAPVRIEPTMGIPSEPDSASDDPAAEEPFGDTQRTGGWIEDALLDVTLELRCVHAFDGVAAIEARAQLDRLALPLPLHLAVWDGKVGRWGPPDRFGFYSEMMIAVQLANRRHSLSEIDASRFIAAVQQISVSIDADFDPPDVARLVQQAAQLDSLCARFDVQITLTLEALGDAWSHAEVGAAATEATLEAVQPERWERVDAQHPTALAMTAASFPTQRLTLTLDVPASAAQPSPLSTLFSVAHQLAARLNARVVDDNARPVEAGARVGHRRRARKAGRRNARGRHRARLGARAPSVPLLIHRWRAPRRRPSVFGNCARRSRRRITITTCSTSPPCPTPSTTA